MSSEAKKIEEQIKPILEKLTYNVLKNKPDNIVSYIKKLIFYIAFIYGTLFRKIRSLYISRINGR